VRLINFCDRCGVGVAALAQQVTDRSAEFAEVAAPVARGPTIPARDIGIAEDCPFAQRHGDQTAAGGQSRVPGVLFTVPAVSDEAPAPAAGVLCCGAAD